MEIEQLTELQVIGQGIAKLDAVKDKKLAGLRDVEFVFEERESSINELKEKIEEAEMRRRELEAEMSEN